MKGNINLISYDCYQQATEKQLAGLKWKENRVYYISEIHNEKMQDEIYGYIDDRCRRLSLSTVVNDIYRFDLLKEFLNEKCTSCSSITDKKWEELERSYKAFLYKKGLALYVRRNRPDRRNVEQQSSAQISFLKMYYEYVVKCKTADIPENEKDVWDMRKLDIVPRSNPIRGRYRLDFREIRQREFKEIIKRILYSHCQTKAMGSIKGELCGFRRFARFMYDRFPEVKHFTEISRDMIEDYLVYIKTDTGLTSVSYTTELSVLDNLLDEIGRELEIENICNLYHDKNIIAGAAYETAVVGSNKAREKPDSQTGSGDRSGTDVAELETLFQSRVNGKCILLSTIQGQVTVEGDEVCVRAQGTWRKMKVSVEKRAAITEPEKKLRDIKKIKEFVNGT